MGGQDRAHGVADRDQFLDDPDVPFRDALGVSTLSNLHRDRLAVNELHQPAARIDEVAAFADARLRRERNIRVRSFPVVEIDSFGLTVIEAFREETDGGVQRGIESDVIVRQAGVGFAEGTGGQGMGSEHHAWMAR